MAATLIPANAQTLRIATYDVELQRDGPGLLLRDILSGADPQIQAVSQVIAAVDPDVLVLQGVDFDQDLVALTALRDFLDKEGRTYPHIFALAPNSGAQTGLDLDGNGQVNEARDAQGYGAFFGQGAMAVLSRYPVITENVRDFTALLWRDLPGAQLPQSGGAAFPSSGVQAMQRLSSVGHWVVPLQLPSGKMTLMTFHATPPVFDGPEDRNGLRNRDEIRFWQRYLDGRFGPEPEDRFILLGQANIDPVDGEGLKDGINGLLSDPRLQDPAPMRPDGPLSDSPGQMGDRRLDTVAWDVPLPGHLRASYILPSAELTVIGSGVFWPPVGDPMAETVAKASRHRLVWVDLRLD